MYLEAISLLFAYIVNSGNSFVIQQSNDFNNVGIDNFQVYSNSPIVISEDGKLTTTELIAKYGYESETHKVETPDGYILEMHRLVGKKNETEKGKKPVVFLMHGLLCSSADWIYMGPEKSLGYLLSNEGFDVWMGNARGNRYSKEHKLFSTQGKEFWQYSWHEIGVLDLPTMIDYALEATSQEKLQYIGHSQGTTAFYVMTSTRPEYNDKVTLMQSLAPVAFLGHMKSPLLTLVGEFVYDIEKITKLLGLHEFLPNQSLLSDVAKIFCKDNNLFNVCLNVIFAVSGADPAEIDAAILPTILGHLPAGASTKQVLHYGQLFKNQKFCQYDYGKKKNLKVYGTETPPDYELANITAPIVLHYGNNDYLATPKDVKLLSDALPNLLESREVAWPKFNHLDFLVAKNVRTLLYDNVLENAKRYSN